MLPLLFFYNILVMMVLGPKKASKFDLFRNFNPKSSYLNIFQKISSDFDTQHFISKTKKNASQITTPPPPGPYKGNRIKGNNSFCAML